MSFDSKEVIGQTEFKKLVVALNKSADNISTPVIQVQTGEVKIALRTPLYDLLNEIVFMVLRLADK